MIIIGFSKSDKLAKSVAKKLKIKYSCLKIKKFPDKETYLKFTTDVKNKTVILFRTLNNPDEKIIELLFAAYTAKDLGAKKVILVVPYLSYMRQDKRFHFGECISNKVIAELFKIFDNIITVDPHLHRIKNLRILFKNSAVINANSIISDYIKNKIKDAVIMGPDAESYQWAGEIARNIGYNAVVLNKKRYNSEKVRIILHDPKIIKDKNIVIIDDIISTGHTMIETVKQAKKYGAKSIACICIHGIYAENALAKLKKLKANVVSTDTIMSETSKITVADLISKELKKLNQ